MNVLTLAEAVARLRGGTLSAIDYANALLERVEATDPAIQAWAHLDVEAVRAQARRSDARDERGPLHGIPVGVKDIIRTRSQPTRMGSPAFDGVAVTEDAECVRRLAEAGAYVFGKTVTTELAFMQPGKTMNPWNARHTPGGSSQGSAAAVAAGHVPVALGTQTNGSVIRPAAYCGVVGFKPTLGAIPFAGAHLFSETLDTLGTFTRTVADASLAFGTLAGKVAEPHPPASLRLAYLPGFPWTQVDSEVAETLDAAATKLRTAGADIVPVALPDALHEAARVHRVIMLSEAARNLRDLQLRSRSRLSNVLNDALDEGAAVSTDDARSALASRAAMIAAAAHWIGHYDAVIVPSAPAEAPEGLGSTGDASCCTLASLLGAPAITLPIGLGAHGLPLGMQLFASPGNDAKLLAVAAWCEARLPFRGLV